MKKILLFITALGALFCASAQTTIKGNYNIQLNMGPIPVFMINGGLPEFATDDGLDATLKSVIKFLYFEDTSINKETFTVFKQNTAGVSILDGPNHVIFCVKQKNHEPIVILENKKTNAIQGGQLVINDNNTNWEIKTDTQVWKQKNVDSYYYWIGKKGRFEVPKNITETAYNYNPQ